MDDVFVSSTPATDAPSQSQGNVGQGTETSVEPSGTRKSLSGKNRKQMDILERMADEVHESTAAQKEHVKILANAISGNNADMKMGEKLCQLGFVDHDAIQILVKINATLELEKSFWGFTDAQLTTLAQDILDENLNY
ncbi:hypothetical protein PIB30_052679 [Stylosanthes scabra]|uniref:Uncharacterized protein n=1 Tax=Stylosanthes scabra TaxID=79078 RepID=A0ABU6SJX1_9FABA|nr:hypothetical protein [Stylosanthes scabra]